MNQKRKQQILLILVVLLWGAIAFQLYAVLKEEPAEGIRTPVYTADTLLEIRESYDLLINYKDPFLKTQEGTVRSEKKSASKIPVAVMPKAGQQVNWSALKFLGSVENDETKERVALVSYDGKMYMLKRNQHVHDFIVSHVYKDSVSISVQNEKRTFK